MRSPHVDDTYICVDTTNRKGKHAIEIRVRDDDECDQNTNGENHNKETRLDGPANKSVEDYIRPAEATPPAGENDDQRNCRSWMGTRK